MGITPNRRPETSAVARGTVVVQFRCFTQTTATRNTTQTHTHTHVTHKAEVHVTDHLYTKLVHFITIANKKG